VPREATDSLDITLIEHKLEINDINHFKGENDNENKDQNTVNTVELSNDDILETEMYKNFDDVNVHCNSDNSKSKE
jgi:hypothetical protein